MFSRRFVVLASCYPLELFLFQIFLFLLIRSMSGLVFHFVSPEAIILEEFFVLSRAILKHYCTTTREGMWWRWLHVRCTLPLLILIPDTISIRSTQTQSFSHSSSVLFMPRISNVHICLYVLSCSYECRNCMHCRRKMVRGSLRVRLRTSVRNQHS